MSAPDLRSPPNTLFRLKEIVPAGEWEAPGGVFPNQRLLLVGATYMALDEGGDDAEGTGGSKLCAPVMTLQYGTRDSYIQGLDDVLAKPALTLAQEFERELSWTDWKGASYTLRNEWAYVCGAAVATPGMTAGFRDRLNDSKLVDDFVDTANAFIRERRAAAGGATLLPEQHAYLSVEEVLSVRLYSGPAYQPINNYLRQLANLTGEYRKRVAQHAALSFSATVGHLYSAIRKLAAVASAEELAAPLYRGVRGELPRRFWVADLQGLVCATDTAFMSTSRNYHTPVDYMASSGTNVLWVLQPQPETDTAFHRGADIGMLSQFAA